MVYVSLCSPPSHHQYDTTGGGYHRPCHDPRTSITSSATSIESSVGRALSTLLRNKDVSKIAYNAQQALKPFMSFSAPAEPSGHVPSLTCARLEDPRVATWLLRPAVLVEDLRFDKLKHDWLRDHTSGGDRRTTGGKKTSARGGTASSKLSSSSKVEDVAAPRNMDVALRQMASDLRDVLVVHSRISMELERVEMMNVFQQQEMPLVPVLAKMETVRFTRTYCTHPPHNPHLHDDSPPPP